MASDHLQCRCHPTPPPPTTCYCTMCYTTTHYSSPPPPSDPILHSVSSHLHHNNHHHSQTHLHAPPQNHHNLHTQHYDHYAPPPPQPQIHQKYQLFQKYHHHHENAQETPPPPINPTVSSLIHRIAALESSLRRRKQSPGSSSLRDAAARTIQTHFRAFLVRRSVTLRHLKELAYIKSALNNLKSSVSDKTHFDSYLISREAMDLLIKLDSIQGSDQMIRDGKRSISRELIRFMELIDEMVKESEVILVKNIRFSRNGKRSVVLQREHKIRASGSRIYGDDKTKIPENLKNQFKNIRVSLVPKVEEEEEVENPRKPGISQNRIQGLLKSQRVVKSQPKVKKNVSFNENGNVFRLIKSTHSQASSDDTDNDISNDDEEVNGASSKETEVEVEEEDSSEMSENEIDPRKNLQTRINQTTKKNQADQESDENDNNDDDDEQEDDRFVFSAPVPAKMEYRVDSVNKKPTAKH